MLQTPNAKPTHLALAYLPAGRGDGGALGAWASRYDQSGNAAAPTLVTLPTATVPASWPHRVLRPVAHSQPGCLNAAHRVIWLKLQAYRLLGRCVALDVDACPVDYIGGLAAVIAPVAMPPGPVADIDMPEPVRSLSTGVMLIDSPEFERVYLELYCRHAGSSAARHPSYAEQCAVIAHARLGGSVLDAGYNGDPAAPGRSRIVHRRFDAASTTR